MPHCFVLQPNGLYAIWSTVTDSFHALNLSKEDAIAYEMDERRSSGYPGGPEALKKDLNEEMRHIDEIGRGWDWARTWNSAITWLKADSPREIETIEELGIPLHMEDKYFETEVERYWRMYWRNRALSAEQEIENFRVRLEQRLEELLRDANEEV